MAHRSAAQLPRRAKIAVAALLALAIACSDMPQANGQPPEAVDPKTEGANGLPFGAFQEDGDGHAPDMGLPAAPIVPPGVPADAAPRESKTIDLRTQTVGDEIVERRDRFTRVWTNADGTQTREIHADPIHFEAKGGWEQIDSTLISDPVREGWFHTSANDWTASFGPVTDDGDNERRLRRGRDGSTHRPSLVRKQLQRRVGVRDPWRPHGGLVPLELSQLRQRVRTPVGD